MSTYLSMKGGVMGNAANLLRATYDAATPSGASALSDTLKLFTQADGFMCNAAGTMVVKTATEYSGSDGDTLTLVCLAGVIYDVQVAQVFATGTTVAAASIVLFRRSI
jgi:hypothetical protein